MYEIVLVNQNKNIKIFNENTAGRTEAIQEAIEIARHHKWKPGDSIQVKNLKNHFCEHRIDIPVS